MIIGLIIGFLVGFASACTVVAMMNAASRADFDRLDDY